MERQYRVILDPFFGDIHDVTDNKGVLKAKRPTQKKPFRQTSRRSSFSTTVATATVCCCNSKQFAEQMESKQNKPKFNQKEEQETSIVLTNLPIL